MRNRNKKNHAQSLNVRGNAKNNATNKGGKSLTPSEAYGITVAEAFAAINTANGDTCSVRKMKTVVYISERDGQSIWLLRKYAAVIKGEQKGLWNGDKHRYEIPRDAWDFAEKAKAAKPQSSKPRTSKPENNDGYVAVKDFNTFKTETRNNFKTTNDKLDELAALLKQSLNTNGSQNAVGRGRGRRSLSGVAK